MTGDGGLEDQSLESLVRGIRRRLDSNHVLHDPGTDMVLLSLLAELGCTFAIGLMIDGVVIRGVIGRDGDFADTADRAIQRGRVELGSVGPGADPDTEGIVSTWMSRSAASKERDAMITDQYTSLRDDHPTGIPLDRIDTDDVASVIRSASPPPWITLSQVVMDSTRIAHMRVATRRISAWWPLDSVEGAQVTYSRSVD